MRVGFGSCSFVTRTAEADACRTPISLPAAMNSASTSEDGQMLAAVGDSTEVYIFVNDGGRWRKHAEVTVADDPCFSSVFSPSQQHLAIGSQDVNSNALFVPKTDHSGHLRNLRREEIAAELNWDCNFARLSTKKWCSAASCSLVKTVPERINSNLGVESLSVGYASIH